jgi:hypothetical protein
MSVLQALLHSKAQDWKMTRALSLARQFIVEGAVPTPDLAAQTWYHGTLKADHAQDIYLNGLKPQEIVRPKAHMAPVPGRVYLTPDLSYAMIYALGANMVGDQLDDSDWIESRSKRDGRYGYVFSVRGSDLKDIYPDEDSIGVLVTRLLRAEAQEPSWLLSMAKKQCTTLQLASLRQGDCAAQARVGKKLLKLMPFDLVLGLIRRGMHISHAGNVPISQCWRYDRLDNHEYRKDGSNFFDLALKVKSLSDIL